MYVGVSSGGRKEQMKKAGVHVHANSLTEKVERDADTGKLTYFAKDGQVYKGFDVVLMAIGELTVR